MTCKCLTLLVLILALLTARAVNAEGDQPPWLRVEANLYPYLSDVETDTDLTAVVNARLPGRFSYFSFFNVRNVVHSGDAEFIRTEQTLRWAISKKLPLDLQGQAVIVNGSDNDIYQAGLSWRVHDTAAFSGLFDQIGLIYRFTVYPFRDWSGNSGAWQLENFFRWRVPGTSRRLYVAGFLDMTFDADLPDTFPGSPIVTEVQTGLRVFKELYVVVEFRNNDFRVGDERNIAAGIEYKFAW